jgi:CRP-like cAMP-binding protein
MVKNPTSARSKSRSVKQTGVDTSPTDLKNRILLDLPRKECNMIFTNLTLVDLPLGKVIQNAAQEIEFCYFPNTAMISILNPMQDGKSVEVGLVGREGFVGMPLVAGFRSSATECVTQGQGNAYRIAAVEMLKALRECPKLSSFLFRHSQEAAMELTQIAACNRLHGIDERLARWLLMSQDRIAQNPLPLTQDFLAQMLGTRRSGVSVAASILQRAGLIQYKRGRVSITDRSGLEQASCECYSAIQKQLKAWHSEIR